MSKRKTPDDVDGDTLLDEVQAMKRLNFFDRLGLRRSATTEEILRTYKKLVLKYHPDKNKNNENAAKLFDLITEAKNTLSDEAQRNAYLVKIEMESKKAKIAGDTPFGMMADTETLNKFVRTMHGNAHHRYGAGHISKPLRTKAPAKIFDIAVTLEQLDGGCHIRHEYDKIRCIGLTGKVQQRLTAIVDVKPGSLDGDKVVHKGAGDEFAGMEAGDLVFLLRQKPHKLFKRRKGADLWIEHNINPLELYTGTEFEFKSVYGVPIQASCTGPLSPNACVKIEGVGMRKKGLATGDPDDERGNVFIKFNVKNDFGKLDSTQMKQLQGILREKKASAAVKNKA